MLRVIRSLGRLSISGYLIISGFVAIAVLATYANFHNQHPVAAKQPSQHATTSATSNSLNLSEASGAQSDDPSASAQTLSDNSYSSSAALPQQSSPVATARHQVKSLVFTPANITLSLAHRSPLVTVSTPDGARISAPEVSSSSGDIGLTVQNSSTGLSAVWQLQLTGQPLIGTYQVTLHAASDTADYVGTMTVIVIL